MKPSKSKAPQVYDPLKIEPKWQKKWASSKLYTARENSQKKKFYGLIEFPFPNAEGLHVGHIRSNTAMDIIARKRRAEGYEVMYPIGWDAFGLPVENFAIKTGIQPSVVTKKNTDTFRKQLKQLGFSFDWSREINTTDPAYYKWTQWIFLQFLKKGLAYKKKMTINWCPKDLIGLANEEVVNGKCDRCGTAVEKKEKEQWMLAITKYADRLDKDLDDVDYLERIKIQQRNWIGKSEGAEIPFRLATKKNRFVIIHGFEGSAHTNFLPWLKTELEKRGHDVEVPELPNSFKPKEEDQVEYVLKNCRFDEHTVVIGHSLGAIVAMKVLLKLNRPVSGLVLVAPAVASDFPGAQKRAYWDSFDLTNIDHAKIRGLTNNKIAILSDTQESFRSKYLKELSKDLGAWLKEVKAAEEHFCAEKEPEILAAITPIVSVFTTRPDTIYGVTYLVLAPEHPWVGEFLAHLDNRKEVEEYIATVKQETEIERTDAAKEKTGVLLKGICAFNPANNEELPVFIADYVLPEYGTGAIMAVPAHDERDFAFAKKYNLPIKRVIEPYVERTTGTDAIKPELPFIERNAAICIVKHWAEDKYLMSFYKKNGWKGFIVGGIENNESLAVSGVREIREESGYKSARFIRSVGKLHSKFFHVVKNVNRYAHFDIGYFELTNGDREDMKQEEKDLHDVMWLSPEEVTKAVNRFDIQIAWNMFISDSSYTGEGLLVNSDTYSGTFSQDIVKKITESVGGTWIIKYKLRDWIFSRQRYWGEPIPVIHCQTCGIVPVPEKDLPVKLPVVKNYKPTETGESPLAAISSWVNVKCPTCKGPAKRETDTMPNWAGSSWYYLRYADPTNSKSFASEKKLAYWTPVDWYNGGMEHTTLHLLYSRFWHKFLYDLKLVPTAEPYQKRTSHGLILAEGGEKMSKSKGNVINPDGIVETLGADALRLYEMFMGPFDQPIVWDTNGIVGTRRFIEKLWRLADKQKEISKKQKATPFGLSKEAIAANATDSGASDDKIINKAVKKVSDDIESMAFNTAVSTLMIAVNELEKIETISKKQYETLLQLVAPFAPHVTEELWASLGNKKSIHLASWPQFDPSLVIESKATIVIQINGKTRGSFSASPQASKEELETAARNTPEAVKWLEGKEVNKVIVVQGRLVNFVVVDK